MPNNSSREAWIPSRQGENATATRPLRVLSSKVNINDDDDSDDDDDDDNDNDNDDNDHNLRQLKNKAQHTASPRRDRAGEYPLRAPNNVDLSLHRTHRLPPPSPDDADADAVRIRLLSPAPGQVRWWWQRSQSWSK